MHYGRASLAAVSELPVLFVFPHTPVHVPSTALAIAQAVGHPTPAAAADQQQPCVVVIPDQGILHASEQLQQQLMARMHKVGPQEPASTMHELSFTVFVHP